MLDARHVAGLKKREQEYTVDSGTEYRYRNRAFTSGLAASMTRVANTLTG